VPIVDDARRAERARDFYVSGAAHGRDVCAESPSNLDGERSDSAGCAVDQYFLPRLDASLAQTLKRGIPGRRRGRRLLERDAGRFRNEGVLIDAGELRKGAEFARAEDIIAGAKLRHLAADRFDAAGNVESEDGVSRPRKSHSQPDEERLSAQ
jgi:hypothetical protein